MDRPETTTDADLVLRCLEGDQVAWHSLVDRYRRLVYSIPHRFRLPQEACDDVFQAVFLALLQNLGKVRDHASLTSWLMTTTRRECSRAVRQLSKHSAVPGDQPVELVAQEPPEAALLAMEERFLVRQAVTRLDTKCRDLLEALFLDTSRPDYDAISGRLGMPLGSIGPIRARCLRKLLKLLEEQSED